jgi:hypothetical protein
MFTDNEPVRQRAPKHAAEMALYDSGDVIDVPSQLG